MRIGRYAPNPPLVAPRIANGPRMASVWGATIACVVASHGKHTSRLGFSKVGDEVQELGEHEVTRPSGTTARVRKMLILHWWVIHDDADPVKEGSVFGKT